MSRGEILRHRPLRALLAAEVISTTGAQMTWNVTIEREGQERPVCVAESISRRYS